MTKRYRDIIYRAYRMINMKLSRARYLIKQCSPVLELDYVSSIEPTQNGSISRTKAFSKNYEKYPSDRFQITLSNSDLEKCINSMEVIYEGDSEYEVDREIREMYQHTTGESSRSMNPMEILSESIVAISNKYNGLVYSEYTRSHPKFWRGAVLSDTDFSIACRKANVSINGTISEDILKNYQEDTSLVIQSLARFR